MADEPKYPLEKAAFAPTDRAMAESWLHSLEVIGPKNVRAHLAQAGAVGPGAAVPIGAAHERRLCTAMGGLARQAEIGTRSAMTVSDQSKRSAKLVEYLIDSWPHLGQLEVRPDVGAPMAKQA